MSSPSLPPIGSDWKVWGRQLVAYLKTSLPKLQWKKSTDNPSENGVILWDEVNGYPVVSKNNEFRQIILADGYAAFFRVADVTFASADTAQVITYDNPTYADGITRGSPTSRIVFSEAGKYLLAFTAQIYSTSAATKTFYFWPRINGVDAGSGSSMTASLHVNSATSVVSRSTIFSLSANDYLEVACACSSTAATLEGFAATAFSPATPSTTLSITRISG